ncbi:unnamed protein product [Caenorhabditis auriculariae]|uniref:Uncharacterized protein n=1 Tax=Caenorhabditis auriculariae TaxID=2777116 RepID=A0A8S1H933_9PELO|nr:unnamed protein product [Caenorhabditis auriculariae]
MPVVSTSGKGYSARNEERANNASLVACRRLLLLLPVLTVGIPELPRVGTRIRRSKMSERRIDVNRSNYSVIDNEFGNMRNRFEQERHRVEEEMRRLRSEFEGMLKMEISQPKTAFFFCDMSWKSRAFSRHYLALLTSFLKMDRV